MCWQMRKSVDLGLLKEVVGVVELEGHLEGCTGFSGQGERLLGVNLVSGSNCVLLGWGACESRVPTGHVL